MTVYQAQHRLIRPVNYCRGCGTELHHLGMLFCTKAPQKISELLAAIEHNLVK